MQPPYRPTLAGNLSISFQPSAARFEKHPTRPNGKVFTFRSARAMFRHYLGKAKWVEFAVQLNEGMVTAMKHGDGLIHATVEEVADWGGISHRTAWTVWKRLKALGWVSCPRRGVIRFDYSRKPTVEPVDARPESAKNAESLNGVVEHSVTEEPIREVVAQGKTLPAVRSAGDGFDSEDLVELDLVKVNCPELVAVEIRTETAQEVPAPSMAGTAIALLVSAGADRAGAVRAVKMARRENRLSLDVLASITAAVSALPTKPYRPGGLIVAAVKNPALGSKLIREHDQARKGVGGASRMPQDVPKVSVCPSVPSEATWSPWEIMRRQVADWLTVADLAEPEDRAWLVQNAARRGWDLDALRTLPGMGDVTA